MQHIVTCITFLLGLMCILCDISNRQADCIAEDSHLLPLYPDSPRPSIKEECTKKVGFDGQIFYTVGKYVHSDTTGNVYANLTYFCHDSNFEVNRTGCEDDLDRHAPNLNGRNLITNRTLKCLLSGCFELLSNGSTYALEDTSCYIDFDECQSSEFHNCREHATCVNDREGTYDCIIFLNILEISDDVVVLSGSTVTLNCTGISEGNVSIVWSEANSGLALPQPDVIMLDENTIHSSITLDSVDSSYSGVYVCNASDETEYVRDSITLSVINIYESPDVLAYNGSNATLFCNASGHPDLEYSWERKLLPFNLTLEDDGFRVSGLNSSELTIISVENDDAVEYICSVSVANEVIGTSTISLSIRVPPSILAFEVPDKIEEGRSETLRCVATGNPLPQITWLHNGTVLDSDDTENEAERREVESVLQLFLTADEHAGNYTCIVDVSGFQTISQTQIVVILAPPTFEETTDEEGTFQKEAFDYKLLWNTIAGVMVPIVVIMVVLMVVLAALYPRFKERQRIKRLTAALRGKHFDGNLMTSEMDFVPDILSKQTKPRPQPDEQSLYEALYLDRNEDHNSGFIFLPAVAALQGKLSSQGDDFNGNLLSEHENWQIERKNTSGSRKTASPLHVASIHSVNSDNVSADFSAKSDVSKEVRENASTETILFSSSSVSLPPQVATSRPQDRQQERRSLSCDPSISNKIQKEFSVKVLNQSEDDGYYDKKANVLTASPGAVNLDHSINYDILDVDEAYPYDLSLASDPPISLDGMKLSGDNFDPHKSPNPIQEVGLIEQCINTSILTPTSPIIDVSSDNELPQLDALTFEDSVVKTVDVSLDTAGNYIPNATNNHYIMGLN